MYVVTRDGKYLTYSSGRWRWTDNREWAYVWEVREEAQGYAELYPGAIVGGERHQGRH